MTYGQTIKWTQWDGTKHAFTVSECESWEEARAIVVEWATERGWTPPKWWQFWRWGDTRLAPLNADE